MTVHIYGPGTVEMETEDQASLYYLVSSGSVWGTWDSLSISSFSSSFYSSFSFSFSSSSYNNNHHHNKLLFKALAVKGLSIG